MNKTIKIEKCGVVNLGSYSSELTVNQDDLLHLLREAVDSAAPACDCNGSFAGRVVIEVEFLGDMLEQSAADSE